MTTKHTEEKGVEATSTRQEQEREAWDDESKCYDIAGSVRPIVTEYWLSRIELARKELLEELIILEEGKRKGHYHPMWNKAKTNTVQELKATLKSKKQ